MGQDKSKETRIVLMSPDLMKLYDVCSVNSRRDPADPFNLDYQPITFCDPQECLDMLVEVETDDIDFSDKSPEAKAERLEKQWGELELRLSFFTDAYKWQ